MRSLLARTFLLLCVGWLLVGVSATGLAQLKELQRDRFAITKAAAEKGDPEQQFQLGNIYSNGLLGAPRNNAEAAVWYRKAAEQGHSDAQYSLGLCYAAGKGVTKSFIEAAKWHLKAAEQGNPKAQYALGEYNREGYGGAKNFVQACKWYRLAAEQGDADARYENARLKKKLTRNQLAEAERLVKDFQQRLAGGTVSDGSPAKAPALKLQASGTGFFISDDGYLITNLQVVKNGNQVRLLTADGSFTAKVVKMDAISELAILKVEGKFSALPVASSRGVRLGTMITMIGFPSRATETSASLVTQAEITHLADTQDDPRHLSLSVPATAANSGGALVDAFGNVIGVLAAKLSEQETVASPITLARTTAHAVKSSYLLSFLESLPDIATRLKEPNGRERPGEEVLKDVQRATALVLVY